MFMTENQEIVVLIVCGVTIALIILVAVILCVKIAKSQDRHISDEFTEISKPTTNKNNH